MGGGIRLLLPIKGANVSSTEKFSSGTNIEQFCQKHGATNPGGRKDIR